MTATRTPNATLRPATFTLARSQRAAAIAGATSLAWAAALIAWGLSLHSVAMTAGGILAAVRGAMGILILVGIRLSTRHSEDFPDGLYKLENIVASVVGVVVLILTYEIASFSLRHLSGTFMFTEDPKYALPLFLGPAVLVGVLASYKRRVAAAERCPSLNADAYFSYADAVALVIIGGATALDVAGFHRADAIAGLLVACFLAVVGGVILVGGLRVLLDASVDREVLSRVEEIAEAHPGVRKVISVDGRNSGSFIFLSIVVEPSAYDLRQASDVSGDLERRIKSSVPNVDRVSIEFRAPADVFTAAVPLGSEGDRIAASFESAPKFGLLEVDGGKVTGTPELVDNPAAGPPAGRGVHLAVFLGRRRVDVLLLKEELTDEDVLQTLQAYAIDVSVSPSLSDLESAVAALEVLARVRKVAPAISGATREPAAG